jgi:membrane peptidoglycan carboxypeptidase
MSLAFGELPGKKPRRSFWNVLAAASWVWLKRLLWVLVFAAGVLTGIGWYWYQEEIIGYSGTELDREQILSIITQESPVYYSDKNTRIGVFFDAEHREYVAYKDLPGCWVDAIVAAEDSNFFQHLGIDPKHVVRAAWSNLKAGKVVAGGSTLSQQTAKNLFYRPDRSWKSKWFELEMALRLEQRYSKEDILEFYANQFHVSANGRGIGIASRYFFNKTPQELSTKECAFIAGMVKAPSRYNPFVGATAERRASAKAEAEGRTSYVLKRMRATGKLDESRFQQAMASPLNFRRGSFQYDRSVVLDEVELLLSGEPFSGLFSEADIERPATAGIQVVTSLNAQLQREATYALWHHLTEVGMVLEKLDHSSLWVAEKLLPPPDAATPLELHGFYYAQVGAKDEGGEFSLDLSGRLCKVDESAQNRMAMLLTRARSGQPEAKADAEGLESLANALETGKIILVSVRELGASALCDLEVRPELQGAVVVLEEGRVRAMVGGNSNRDFNRAITAKRQFGSTWKPLVYYAALQLGWLPEDMLDNRRNAFVFQDIWYYPHADHSSSTSLNMREAGARSENLASVWLLAHLTDRLDDSQFQALAESLGIWNQGGERASVDRFEEFAFTRARQEVLSGLPYPEDELAVRSMLHGHGTAAERARLENTPSLAERNARVAALNSSFTALEARVDACRTDPTLLWVEPEGSGLACGDNPPEGWVRLEPVPVEAESPWGEIPSQELGPDTLIDGRIHLGTLQALRSAVDRVSATLSGQDTKSPGLYPLNPDFRTLVGIRFLQHLAKQAGVTTELPTVMSLPLGAADVSLMEMSMIYQSFLQGSRWSFPGKGFKSGAIPGVREPASVEALAGSTALVEAILDSGGNALYRVEPAMLSIGNKDAGALTGSILRQVVMAGTGRRAAQGIPFGNGFLPVAGKTGTTNDYRNAAFLGFVPKVENGKTTWGKGFTVAVYVGYDDNRSMRRGSYRLQGASGALPAWLGVARGLVAAGLVGQGEAAEWTDPMGSYRRVAIPNAPVWEQEVVAPAGEVIEIPVLEEVETAP